MNSSSVAGSPASTSQSSSEQQRAVPEKFPQASGRHTPAAGAKEAFRILVVEDDMHIARLMMANLSKLGFECRGACDGRNAMLAFVESKPHLVLLDLRLPGMDGNEICARIRISSTIPIIVVTAQDDVDLQLRLLKAGADDFISKPFDVNVLVARVVVNLRRAYRYDIDVPIEAAALPNGWATCDSCQYLGPVARFEAQDHHGRRVMRCPHCQTINRLAFGIG
jgi:DNA-binding response OmpR family regulator